MYTVLQNVEKSSEDKLIVVNKGRKKSYLHYLVHALLHGCTV